MAALLVLAGAIINDRIKEKKQMKRRKELDDERRYRQLQAAEIERREKKAAVARNYDSEDEKEGEALPRYEDVINNGEGSSNGGSGVTSDIQVGSDAPPDYGRQGAQIGHNTGVGFSREAL